MPKEVPLSAETIRNFLYASTATVSMQMLKRGFRNCAINGVRLTRLGRRVYSNSLTPMTDPWGRPIYWIGGGSATWRGSEDSDFRAIDEGFISVTPLHLDLTNKDVLDAPESWWRAP